MSDPIGQVVAGKYRLVRVLGQGGMGVVYEAVNEEIGRKVAVKRLLAHVVARSPAVRVRFEREARVAAIVGDPRIVEVLDIVWDGDGTEYIVMELLSGESLGARLSRETALPLGEAASIMRHVLGALGAAHDKGVIHRDIKPDNIFLVSSEARAAGSPAIKLLDFGIAKRPGTDTKLTRTDAVMGTPFFMSPEQARSSSKVDHRSDLYSSAAVLFATVTGRTVFAGTSLSGILLKLLTEPAPHLKEIAPDAPDELVRFFARALDRDPARRHQTAAEMWGALEPMERSPWRAFKDEKDPAPFSMTLPLGETRTLEIDSDSAFDDTHIRRARTTDPLALPEAVRGLRDMRGESGPRYEPIRLLSHGGMGEVYLVVDKTLGRHVALKRVLPERMSPEAREHLLYEARIAAELEHPNIIPVHEIGALPGGEPYYTMKHVTGESLRRVLRRLSSGDEGAVRRFDHTRLVIVFLQVVQAIAHAHARGVLHCDVHPGNVLVGEHGEVLLTDWGLAERLSGDRRAKAGTVPYLSPEQARGDRLDQRSDIYALGTLLYEMLTLEQPFSVESPRQLLDFVAREALVPPRKRAPDRGIREEIEAICLTAMQRDPPRRYQSAEELRSDVEEYLTGARRRQLVKVHVADAEDARQRWESLRAERLEIDLQIESLSARIKPYDGELKKAPLWNLEAQRETNELAASEALAEAMDRYAQAIAIDPEDLEAKDRLADLHLALFLDAESRQDRKSEAFHRRQVERLHRGRHDEVLFGRGTVSIKPEDPAARVRGFSLVEHGKKIVIGDPVGVPERGFRDLILPSGSYLFTVAAPNKREANVHVFVGRGSEIELSPKLFTDAQIGEGFIYVPEGPFIYGGDPHALNSAPRQELWLPDFFIAKHPVTCQEYLDFLSSLAAEDPLEARKYVPRTKAEGGYLWEPDSTGKYVLPRFDADGDPCHPRAPVMGVSWYDAERYVDWRSKKDRVSYRLPTEHEWEKASRGADGRFFPWGNGFDPTFCKMALSRPGRPQPEPVGSFPADTSVYGMMDAAGAIREWCDSIFDPSGETRVLRGGAWYFNPHYCRLAFRHGYLPYIVFTNFGFRLVKPAP
jgi:eukaryotic-like serine/threonine-protein kinase